MEELDLELARKLQEELDAEAGFQGAAAAVLGDWANTGVCAPPHPPSGWKRQFWSPVRLCFVVVRVRSANAADAPGAGQHDPVYAEHCARPGPGGREGRPRDLRVCASCVGSISEQAEPERGVPGED